MRRLSFTFGFVGLPRSWFLGESGIEMQGIRTGRKAKLKEKCQTTLFGCLSMPLSPIQWLKMHGGVARSIGRQIQALFSTCYAS